MMEEIRFNDSNKCIHISIDNETQEIPIFEIDRLETYIILKDIIDAPLNEKINIDALLCYIPYENDNTENNETMEPDINIPNVNNPNTQVIHIEKNNKKHYVTDLDGTVEVIIYQNEKKIYYQNNVTFKQGKIQDNIINTLPLGSYKAVIKFEGNKYLQPTVLNIEFKVNRRRALCIFSEDTYYGLPDESIKIIGYLKDKINNKPIKNCTVSFDFDGNTYSTSSNAMGEIDLLIQIPEANASHCQILEESYANVSYPVVLYLDSEAYELDNYVTNVVVKKLPTETSINEQTNVIDNVVTLSGSVIAEYKNNEIKNAKYGKVIISFEDTDYVSEPININDDGNFTVNINFADINDYNNVAVSDQLIKYEAAIQQITSINLTVEEYVVKTGELITANANVFSEESSDYVKNGMVVFILAKDEFFNKEVYRYATEIDNIGQAIFLFNTSVENKYYIKAYYYGIFGLQDAESKIIEVEVKDVI